MLDLHEFPEMFWKAVSKGNDVCIGAKECELRILFLIPFSSSEFRVGVK